MTLGVAVVGVGHWGRQHVRVLSDLPRARLLWLCDKVPAQLEGAKRFAAHVRDVKTTDDLERVLADRAVDVVVVAAPSPAHHAVARAVLASGRHCFVEKPIALTRRDAEDLHATATAKGRVLMVGHLLLYHPAYRRVVSLIEQGELGEVYYLHSRRTNLGIVRTDENAWWSLAPHDISIAIDMFGGPPETISASGGCWVTRGVEDTVFAVMRWPDGKIAQAHVSWLDPHKKREITIVGSKKMVVWDDTNTLEMLRVYDKGIDKKTDYQTFAEFVTHRSGDVHLPAVPLQEPLRLELDHLIEAIETPSRPRTDGQNGIDVVRVLEAGQRSLSNGGAPERV
jgi:predicted dehydrogenase